MKANNPQSAKRFSRTFFLIISIISLICGLTLAWYETRIHYIRQSLNLPNIALDVNIYNEDGDRVNGRTINSQTDANQINVNSILTALDGNAALSYNNNSGSITAYIRINSDSESKLDVYTKVLINNSDRYNALESYFRSCIVDITEEVNGNLDTYVLSENASIKGEDFYNAYEGSEDLKYYGQSLFDLQYLKLLEGSYNSGDERYYRMEIYTDSQIYQTLLSSANQVLDFTVEVVGKQEGQPVDDIPVDYTFEITTEEELLDAINKAGSGNTILIRNDITVHGNITFYKPVSLFLDNCTLTINGDLNYDLTSLYSNDVSINLSGNSALEIGYNLNINAPGNSFSIIGSNTNLVSLGLLNADGNVYVDSVLNTGDPTKGFKLENVVLKSFKQAGVYEDSKVYIDSTTNVVIGNYAKVGQLIAQGPSDSQNSATGGASRIYIYVYGEVVNGIDLSNMKDAKPTTAVSYPIPTSQNPTGYDQIYILVYGTVGKIPGSLNARYYLPNWASSYKDANVTVYDTDHCNTRIAYDISTGITDTTDYVITASSYFVADDIEVVRYNANTVVERIENCTIADSLYGGYLYKGVTYSNAYRIVINNYEYDGELSEVWGDDTFITQQLLIDHFNLSTEDAYAMANRDNIEAALASIDYIEVVYQNNTTQGLSYTDLAYLSGRNPQSIQSYILSGMEYLNLSNALAANNLIPSNSFGASGNLSPITGIELPNTVEIIRSGAFFNTKIAFIDIPASVTTINSDAFIANSDNGYGGYLFVSLKTNNALTQSIMQGFQKNDKTYVFVSSSVDMAFHNCESYIDPESSTIKSSAFLSDTGINSYWWYYVYENASLSDYSCINDSLNNNTEHRFRFVRNRSVGYELALVIAGKTNPNATYFNNEFNDYYNYLLPSTIAGKNIYSIGARAYTHSGVRNISYLNFYNKANYTKIGDEAFRMLSSASGTLSYESLTLKCDGISGIFNLGNINNVGNYAFACAKTNYDITLEFPDLSVVGIGSFDGFVNTNRNINITFLGNAQVGSYAFYKGTSGTGKINTLQLGGVDYIGAYAFAKQSITNIPYRNKAFSGMRELGDYAFSSCIIGTSGATAYDNTILSMLYLDLSLADDVDIRNGYVFKSSKFYGAVLKVNSIPLIDTTIFNSAEFTSCLINVDYSYKIVTGAFTSCFKTNGSIYCDINAMNVPNIEPAAFVGSYFGTVKLGLNDEQLIAINKSKENEEYSWGGTLTFAYNGTPYTYYCGIISARNSLVNKDHGISNTTVRYLIIDGDIPYNTQNYVFSSMCINKCPNDASYSLTLGISYGTVEFTNNFHGCIPNYAFSIGGNNISTQVRNINTSKTLTIGTLILGDNVTEIGDYAFSSSAANSSSTYCNSIGTVSIDFSNIKLNNCSFYRIFFTNLASLTIKTTTTNTRNSFAGCTFSALKSLSIENGISLADYTFNGCSFPVLPTLTIGDNVTVGQYAFAWCAFNNLSSFVYGNNLNLSYRAFYYADIYKIASLELGKNMTIAANAFEYADFFGTGKLTIKTGTTVGTYAFYYSKLPIVSEITFESGTTIPDYCFRNATVGNSYSGNVLIKLNNAERIGCGILAAAVIKGNSIAAGLDLQAKDVGKIESAAFSAVYWHSAILGLSSTNPNLNSSDNYWGRDAYSINTGIFGPLVPSWNSQVLNNAGNRNCYVGKLTIDGEFPQNSTYSLTIHGSGMQRTVYLYYDEVEFTSNCTSIPAKVFYHVDGTTNSSGYVYINKQLKIASNTYIGDYAFYYVRIGYSLSNDSELTMKKIIDRYTAGKCAVSAFYNAYIRDYVDTTGDNAGIYTIDYAVPDNLFKGTVFYNTNITKVVFDTKASIGQYAFQSAYFSYAYNFEFKNCTLANYAFNGTSFGSSATQTGTLVFNATNIGKYSFASASFPKATTVTFNAPFIDNYGFSSASFGALQTGIIQGSTTVCSRAFDSTNFGPCNTFTIKNTVILNSYGFSNAYFKSLSLLKVEANSTIPTGCFVKASFGSNYGEHTLIDVRSVKSIGICAFSGINYNIDRNYVANYAPNLDARDVGIIDSCAFGTSHWNKVYIGLSPENENKDNTSYYWGGTYSTYAATSYGYNQYQHYGIFSIPDRNFFGESVNSNESNIQKVDYYHVVNLIVDGEFPVNSYSRCLGTPYWSYFSCKQAYDRVEITSKCTYIPDEAFLGTVFSFRIYTLIIDEDCDVVLGNGAFRNVRCNPSTWDLSGVVEIGEYALSGMSKWSSSYSNTDLKFPKLTKITGDNAFLNNTCIKSIEFGETLEYIYGADDFKGMTNLTTITLKRYDENDAQYPITVLLNAIPSASKPSSLTKIRVQSKALNAYKSAANWIDYQALFDYYLAMYCDNSGGAGVGNWFNVIINDETNNYVTLSTLIKRDVAGNALAIADTITINSVVYTVTELDGELLSTSAGQSIKSISIPEHVLRIDPMLFDKALALETIIVDANNVNYASERSNTCLVSKVVAGSSNPKVLYRVMPAATASAFDCTTEIDCAYIYSHAFAYTKNLSSLTFATSLVAIGEEAFLDCNATSITFNGSLVPIILGENTFGDARSIDADNIVPKYLMDNTLAIHVPASLLNDYKINPGFYKYRSLIVAIPTIS